MSTRRTELETKTKPLALQGVESDCERLILPEINSGGWDRTSDKRLMKADKKARRIAAKPLVFKHFTQVDANLQACADGCKDMRKIAEIPHTSEEMRKECGKNAEDCGREKPALSWWIGPAALLRLTLEIQHDCRAFGVA